MKLSVCGKGGSGKSTITTLLGKEFSKMGKSVLVIDSDESNYGLHRQLGMELPKDFTGYFGGKEKVLGDMMLSNFSHQFFNSKWTVKDIPEGFFVEKEGVKLMASGKIHTANEGCACAMGAVLTQFISNLEVGKNEVAIIDMEAGIEHFGRGVDNGVDAVLMIVDPSFESLKLSKKVMELGTSIGKPVYFILNKVNNENHTAMRKSIADSSQIIGELQADDTIMIAGLEGKELDVKSDKISKIAEYLDKNITD